MTRPPRPTERTLNLVGAVVGIAGVAAAVAIVLIVTAGSHKTSVTHPAGERGNSARHQVCRQVGDSESPFACSLGVERAALGACATLVTFVAVRGRASVAVPRVRRLDRQL